ncbi:MAG: chemotaxis protein CheA [bacterium]|nr:chemotaxis protein CheA [bacterium]
MAEICKKAEALINDIVMRSTADEAAALQAIVECAERLRDHPSSSGNRASRLTEFGSTEAPPTRVEQVLENLTRSILLVDAAQSEPITELSRSLDELAQLMRQGSEPCLVEASRVGAHRLRQIAAGQEENAEASLEIVEKLIKALQSVLIDGQPLGAVESWLEAIDDSADGAQGIEVSPAADATGSEAASENGPPATAGPLSLSADADLVAEFITESREHLDAVDGDLLTIEKDPSNEEALNSVFRAFHTIKGVAGFLELTPIQQLAHETETLLDRSRKGKLKLACEAIDVVFAATDVMKELVAAVEQAASGDGEVLAPASLPDLILQVQRIAEGGTAVVEGVPQSPAEAPVVETPVVEAPVADAAVPERRALPTPPRHDDSTSEPPARPTQSKTGGAREAGRAKTVAKETIRVDAERLDMLVDTIGEMVIAEAMVCQSVDADGQKFSSLSRMLNHLDKITRELQELAMSMRMVPVRSTFQRMARLARDVSKKLGKPITFVTSGEDTELDKNVVDAIGDPLVHMVRNAIDHGIESSTDDRQQTGKPDAGRVELRAFHKGGNIYIEIEDDGRGLDRERLIAKAKDRGVLDDGESLSDAEAYNLIFEPGFSTAREVTDVSGRGVGLDVVKRSIQALRGKTEIRSEKGKGTVFSIRLPLTLAIIEGMVIRLGSQRFVVPTLSIVRMVRPGESDLSTVFGRGEMLKLGDRLVPLFRFDQLFAIEGMVQDACEAAVVVVEHENQQVAFLADELLGQQQIVIKPLGAMFKNVAGFSGGAIMPDGRVGLILDVPGLAAIAAGTTECRRAAQPSARGVGVCEPQAGANPGAPLK